MNTQLYKNIIATITYFDVMDYPLTAFEIWKHLIQASPISSEMQNEKKQWSLTEVLQLLENQKIKEYVGQKNGWYFLVGREKIVGIRSRREILNTYKIRKLSRRVKLLKSIPFVRMICLTGRLSQKNGTEDSDLDVLIVIKDGHLWTGRFLITVITHFLRWRRHSKKQKDRICLNYFMSDKFLKVPTKDLFAAQEYSFILPIFDQANFFQQFQQTNSSWIREYKPDYCFTNFHSELTIEDSYLSSTIRKILEKLFSFSFLERKLRKIQKEKIENNPKTKLKNSLIIANDQHLVFLPKPHGPKIFSEYKRRFEALEIG
jgi:hypothetical protein